jgi:hypothetical protein
MVPIAIHPVDHQTSPKGVDIWWSGRVTTEALLNKRYGRRTALTTLLGQVLYGAILGAAYSIHL